jgi:hypothetical protein
MHLDLVCRLAVCDLTFYQLTRAETLHLISDQLFTTPAWSNPLSVLTAIGTSSDGSSAFRSPRLLPGYWCPSSATFGRRRGSRWDTSGQPK